MAGILKEKAELHSRNKHNQRYDFERLMRVCPELGRYVKINKYNDQSIDFFNPKAVKTLNKALLKQFYGIDNWDIPNNYLTPPIPGRADYIHYAADLLSSFNSNKIPHGKKIRCLDIGVGANCIYPIIGNYEYGWSFVGTDVDSVSLKSARRIIESNSSLKGNIELRLQENANDIFTRVIKNNEFFDVTICNPPFHASAAKAEAVTIRKLSNLKKKTITKATLNFGGQNSELWCNGGERRFIKDMILQSKQVASSCFWFTTLVSKESNLKSYYGLLEKVSATEIKTIKMSQGNKSSRLVAWTFFSKENKQKWQRELKKRKTN
ncbi:MAG: 23S rRNA (adenine(1618)-N(6))-methyltransferase RlmF [Bacteroidota bacterium]